MRMHCVLLKVIIIYMRNDSWGVTFVHYLEIEVSLRQWLEMYGVHAVVGRGHGVCCLWEVVCLLECPLSEALPYINAW